MQPIERKSVSELVVDKLEQLIMSGEYQVGDRLPTEKELCEMLEVSRTTIRESLRMLKAMDYIDILPGKGTFVLKVTKDDENDYFDWFAQRGIEYGDFMDVRLMLEPWATKLAVQRASDREIDNLEKTFQKFIEAYNNDDYVGLVTCDEQFHAEIFKMSKNPLLISMNDKITEYFTAFRVKTYNLDFGVSNAIEPHQKIFDAIKERNVLAAEFAMQEHIKEIIKDISNARIQQKKISKVWEV